MVSSPLDPFCELVEPQKLHGAEQSGLKSSDPLYLCSKAEGWRWGVQDWGQLSRLHTERPLGDGYRNVRAECGTTDTFLVPTNKLTVSLFDVTCERGGGQVKYTVQGHHSNCNFSSGVNFG